MIGDKRLVVCVPAGRRRYLELTARHVLADPAVDELRLWRNTTDAADIAWMTALATAEPRVNVHVPTWRHEGNYSIHRYFRACADPGCVYVRVDDDVVWMGPGAVAGLARYRLDHPGPFLVYGNVLNSGLTSHLHQRYGRLPPGLGRATYHCTETPAWREAGFAVALHRALQAAPDPARWVMPDWELYDYERHSINVIAWTGADAVDWAARVGRDEEQWLAVEEPRRRARPNRIAGAYVFAHYAFYTQRAGVDADPGVLAGYRALAGGAQ